MSIVKGDSLHQGQITTDSVCPIGTSLKYYRLLKNCYEILFFATSR